MREEVLSLPPNGSMIIYDKKSVGMAYRRDGYIWKTRKDGKNTREDHMKLKVKGADVSLLSTQLVCRFYCLLSFFKTC